MRVHCRPSLPAGGHDLGSRQRRWRRAVNTGGYEYPLLFHSFTQVLIELLLSDTIFRKMLSFQKIHIVILIIVIKS